MRSFPRALCCPSLPCSHTCDGHLEGRLLPSRLVRRVHVSRIVPRLVGVEEARALEELPALDTEGILQHSLRVGCCSTCEQQEGRGN